MKKILAILFIIFISLTQVFASDYDLTEADEEIIDLILENINNKIEENGESYREPIVSVLEEIIEEDYSPRVTTIVEEVKKDVLTELLDKLDEKIGTSKELREKVDDIDTIDDLRDFYEEEGIFLYNGEPVEIERYRQKQEFFVPVGNPDNFSLDTLEGLKNAYGVNTKEYYIVFDEEYEGSYYTEMDGFVEIIQSYTDKPFCFISDFEEGEINWLLFIDLDLEESEKFLEEFGSDEKIDSVSISTSIMPMFNDYREDIEEQISSYRVEPNYFEIEEIE